MPTSGKAHIEDRALYKSKLWDELSQTENEYFSSYDCHRFSKFKLKIKIELTWEFKEIKIKDFDLLELTIENRLIRYSSKCKCKKCKTTQSIEKYSPICRIIFLFMSHIQLVFDYF